MAQFVHDHSVTSVRGALYALKAAALASTYGTGNWTLRTSGNGSVYSQAGDVIASASDLAVAGSWFVLRGKGTVDGGVTYYRELCLQVDSSGNLRGKYSPRAGFVGGSPSPTRTPSATDERYFLGGGSDASPTYEALLPSSGAWLQARYDEASDALAWVAYPVGGGLPTAVLFLGVCAAVYDTTGGLVDHDPAVVYARQGSTSALADSLCSEVYGPLGLLSYLQPSDGSADAWVRLPASLSGCYDAAAALQRAVPGGLPATPGYSPAVYAQDTLRFRRRAAVAGTSTGAKEGGNLNTCGHKGEELSLRLSGTRFATPTLLDSVDPSSGQHVTGSLLGVGDLIIPWELALPVSI